MDAPNEQHTHRWDPAPLEETLAGARALTVSVAEQMMRDGWEQLAQVAGIPARRWRRHHPVGDGPLLAIVDGEAVFDAAAWVRFASLVPGAVALPTRTAAALGVAPRDLAPPGRQPSRLADLVRSRRMRTRLRRAERRLDADLAVARARLQTRLHEALVPGEDGTAFEQLPAYALAARLDLVLAAGRGWRTAAIVELANGYAVARLLRLLVERGAGPGTALLDLAVRTTPGQLQLPPYLAELEQVAHMEGAARDAAFADWSYGLGGWHAMRDLLLEAPPLRDDPAAVRAALEQVGQPPTRTAATMPALDAELEDAARRARALVRHREVVGQLRSDLHAALRAVTHALAARLAAEHVLPDPDAAFDLHVLDLLRAARGVVTSIAPLAVPTITAEAPRRADAAFVPELRGIPASGGRAQGPVVVVDDPALDARVDGAVLVCRSTDPAWLPLMLRCAALVTERGGPLSHAAIVARELGLPAVVGAAGACAAASVAVAAEVDGADGSVRFQAALARGRADPAP